ncbi:helix-turn-helix domain-containing protein [Sphingobium chungangianum]
MARAGNKEDRLSPIDCLTVRIPDAAQMLGIGRSTFYKLMRAGEVETIKLGRSTLISVTSLEALLNRRRGTRPSR